MDPLFAHTFDARFPTRVRQLEPPPSFIHARGPLAERLDRLDHPVAIVGTRRATQEGMRWARYFAGILARRGMTVVSGGATGIDTHAHVGAIEGGGRTVVVLPTGIDVRPDDARAQLFDIIETNGAIVSVANGGAKATRESNFERNGVIAALADDVIVVEAPIQSGARNTAKHARDLGRRLWVIPASPLDARRSGAVVELQNGARALSHPRQILELHRLPIDGIPPFSPYEPGILDPSLAPFGCMPASNSLASLLSSSARTSTLPSIAATPEEQRVLEALQKAALTIDELVLESALEVGALRALLLTWTVDGVVREGPTGRFRLVTH